MIRYIAAYVATGAVMVVLDLLWLGVIAKPLYQQGIGHLMADRPNIVVAGLFYAIYPLGLVFFALAPHTSEGEWSLALRDAALFGFMAYATYDLTNLATLKGWPVALSLIDIAWGTALSTVSVAAGKFALHRFLG